MKKFFTMLFAICFLVLGGLSLSACSLNNTNTTTTTDVDAYSIYLKAYSDYINKTFEIDSYKETHTYTTYDTYGFEIETKTEVRRFFKNDTTIKYEDDDTQDSGDHLYIEIKDKNADDQYKITNYDLCSKTYTTEFSTKTDIYLTSRVSSELYDGYLYNKEALVHMDRLPDDTYKFYFVELSEIDHRKNFISLTFKNGLITERDYIFYDYTEAMGAEYTDIQRGRVLYEYNTGDFEIDVSECQPA